MKAPATAALSLTILLPLAACGGHADRTAAEPESISAPLALAASLAAPAAVEAGQLRAPSAVEAAGLVGDAATFPVIIALDATDLDLRPGMTGRAEISGGSESES